MRTGKSFSFYTAGAGRFVSARLAAITSCKAARPAHTRNALIEGTGAARAFGRRADFNQGFPGKEVNQMAGKSRINVPEAGAALDNMKYEIARELGVNLNKGYNGDLTSRENGYVGGYMVKNV